MKKSVVLLVVILGGIMGTAPAKTKKQPVLSQLFCQARFVYVETADGTVYDPQAVPADRDVAAALEQHLQDWKRYALVARREEADLVWVVRTGRAVGVGVDTGYPTGETRVGARVGAGTSSGPGAQGSAPGGNLGSNGQDPGNAGSGRGTPGAVSTQVGDPSDLLTIYEGDAEGSSQHTRLWRKSESGGLVDPGMPLFEQIRNAVDTGCAPPAPTHP